MLLIVPFFLYLIDGGVQSEAGEVITLGHLLQFFTGTDMVPPLGFPRKPTLNFTEGKLATASTCEPVLRLPLGHSSYGEFKKFMTVSIVGSNDIFGCV